MKKAVLFVVGFTIGFNLCGCLPRKTLARVGRLKITRQQVAYREKLNQVEYPSSALGIALGQLVQVYVKAEILSQHQNGITHADLESESRRVDLNTKNPENLQKIKNIFGADHESYLSTFILPELVEQKIAFEFFPRNEKIHQASRREALLLIDQLRATKKADSSYAKIKIFYQNEPWKEDRKKEIHKPNELGADPSHSRELFWSAKDVASFDQSSQGLLEFFKTSSKQVIYPNPIEHDTVWWVIRFLKKQSATRSVFECFIVPKLDYGIWLNAEKAKVAIEYR